MTEVKTGKRELLWKENEPIEAANRMFGFTNTAVILNFKSDEMKGAIAPTDTRFRGDQRLFEEGEVDAADEEKVRLEVKQRKARKIRQDQGQSWKTNFFREVPHPKVEGEVCYEMFENYWARRERKEWSGLPDLW